MATSTIPQPSATPSIPTPDLRALDAIRQRLSQLSSALLALRAELEHADPLPPWHHIQSSAAMLLQSLQSIAGLLDAHAPFLDAARAFPLPSFPDRSHEVAVGQLLAKREKPEVQDWVERARERGARAGEGGGLGAVELDELWGWALRTAATVSDEIPWGIDYTLEERDRLAEGEEVVTGLKRKLDDGMEDVSDDEDGGGGEADGDKMDEEKKEQPANAPPVKPPMPIEDVLRFFTSGQLPPARPVASGMPLR